MVFARLQALGAYFDQLQSSPEYERVLEGQCVEIVAELRSLKDLTLENATPLLALIQQNTHWSEDQKKTMVQTIHGKVEETLTGKGLGGRPSMQDYTLFPLYLTRNDWYVILSREHNVALKCNTVMDRLYGLGARHPTEFTYAMATACVLLTEPERFSDPLQLRSSYITVKGLCKTHLNSKLKSGDAQRPTVLLKALPPVRTALPEPLLRAAYETGEEAMHPLPHNITMEGLKQLESLISCRSNNAKLQLQLPKACGVPVFNQAMATTGIPVLNTPLIEHRDREGKKKSECTEVPLLDAPADSDTEPSSDERKRRKAMNYKKYEVAWKSVKDEPEDDTNLTWSDIHNAVHFDRSKAGPPPPKQPQEKKKAATTDEVTDEKLTEALTAVLAKACQRSLEKPLPPWRSAEVAPPVLKSKPKYTQAPPAPAMSTAAEAKTVPTALEPSQPPSKAVEGKSAPAVPGSNMAQDAAPIHPPPLFPGATPLPPRPKMWPKPSMPIAAPKPPPPPPDTPLPKDSSWPRGEVKPGQKNKSKGSVDTGGSKESKPLTGKKLEQKLKRDAEKLQRQEAAAKKKEESDKKKAAAATSKKTLQLATRICGSLTNAWTGGADVLEKAMACHLPEEGDVVHLKEWVQTIDGWRKTCTNVLNAYTKNNKADLPSLDFDLEIANDTIKECLGATKSVRKLIQDFKKKQAAAKAAAKGS
eukprot:Skav232029  [mRNA]  locus=scaffold541:222660:229830:+ [translate_table: standard]